MKFHFRNNDWERGYFCAIAKRIQEDGLVDSVTSNLFSSGGDWRRADQEDIAIFIQYGLIENPDVSILRGDVQTLKKDMEIAKKKVLHKEHGSVDE